MKIVISQIKPYLGDIKKNLEKMIENIEEGIKNNADIIVFPELSLTGTILLDGVYDNYISLIPKKLLELSKNIIIIFGAIEEENNKLYNSAFVLNDGKILGKHRKIFLSNGNGVCETKYYKRGKNIEIFEDKSLKFGITLGEECLNGTLKDILSKKGAEVIFNLANVSVSEDIEVYKGSLVGNSYYNKNFNIFVNRVGVEDGVIFVGNSFITLPNGKIIEKVEKFNEKLSIIDIDLKDVRREEFKSSFDNEDNLEIIKKELENLMRS